MAIRELVARLAQKSQEKKRRFKEMEDQFQMEKKLMEKQKSSNERELQRFMEEEREKSIKAELEEFRNARNQKDGFLGGETTIMKQDFNILHNPNPIMNNDNLFMKKGNMMGTEKKPINGGNLFFK